MGTYIKWLLIPLFGLAGFIAVISTRPNVARLARRRASADATLRDVMAHYAEDWNSVRARSGLLQSAREDPSDASTQFYLGFVNKELGDYRAAVRAFQRFCRLEPFSARSELARAELQRLSQIEKTSPEAQRNFRYDLMIAQAQQAIARGTLRPALLIARQASLVEGSRWEAYAIAALTAAKLKQYKQAANLLLISSARSSGRIQAQLQAALARCRKQEAYASYTLRGAHALTARKYAQAADAFDQAWKLFPQRGEYGLALALAQALGGHRLEARKTLAKLEVSPDSRIVKRARAMRLALAG